MKTIQFLCLVTVVALFSGCAAVAPNELINARSAYEYASAGPAAQLAPAELHKAHEALLLAEASFQENHDSYETRDLAYVAQRKSELAGAYGAMAADKASKVEADADFDKKQTEIVNQGKQDLRDSEQRTADDAAPSTPPNSSRSRNPRGGRPTRWPSLPCSPRSRKRNADSSSRSPGASCFDPPSRTCCPPRR